MALAALHVLAAALVAALTELGIPAGWSALIVGVGLALIAWAMVQKGVNELKLRMEEILDYDSFEKRMHGFLGAALDDVVHETNELTDQIAKLRELWPSAAGDDDGLEPNFALFFGYDPNDPELEQDPVTELDVFVDIALQVLRVVHLLANAEEALDSPLRPIRERIKLSKHELVQAYKKHCSDEEWTQADDDEERD